LLRHPKGHLLLCSSNGLGELRKGSKDTPRYPIGIEIVLGTKQSLRAMLHKLIGQAYKLYFDIVNTRALHKLKHSAAKTASDGILLNGNHSLCVMG